MRTIPLLPCASIDEIAQFADHLGFRVTYRQVRPNPYVALDRDGLELHYFGIPGFLPEDSYGSCVVITDDIEALFDAFAAGLRAAYGKLPVSGFPRITRPRRRKNNDNRTGFSLVDPSGNWIRVTAERSPVESSSDASVSRLRAGVDNAVVIADSHGDAAQAAKILAGALARDTTAGPEERRESTWPSYASAWAIKGPFTSLGELQAARLE